MSEHLAPLLVQFLTFRIKKNTNFLANMIWMFIVHVILIISNIYGAIFLRNLSGGRQKN